ncbi:MAG: hypothetical protein ACRC2K_13335 [Clostridium sp.]
MMIAPEIKLYKDKKCNFELDVDSDGNYFYKLDPVSSSIPNINLSIWCKNIGNSPAYDLNLNILFGELSSVSSVDKIDAGKTSRVKVSIPSVNNKFSSLVVILRYDGI